MCVTRESELDSQLEPQQHWTNPESPRPGSVHIPHRDRGRGVVQRHHTTDGAMVGARRGRVLHDAAGESAQ